MATWYIDSNGNKHLISGMVTGELPKYTMAEYTALTDKPIDWICTDYDATSEYGINATEVKYDSSTNVKDKIDSMLIKNVKKNIIFDGVNYYKNIGNPYTYLDIDSTLYEYYGAIFTTNGYGFVVYSDNSGNIYIATFNQVVPVAGEREFRITAFYKKK